MFIYTKYHYFKKGLLFLEGIPENYLNRDIFVEGPWTARREWALSSRKRAIGKSRWLQCFFSQSPRVVLSSLDAVRYTNQSCQYSVGRFISTKALILFFIESIRWRMSATVRSAVGAVVTWKKMSFQTSTGLVLLI